MALTGHLRKRISEALLGWSEADELGDAVDANTLKSGITSTDPASVTITVAAEDTNVRQIAIAVLDSAGTAVAAICNLDVYVFLDAAGAALATTGGSTGIALGTGANGILAATVVAKKVFKCITEPTGVLDLKWTDTGSEAAYLGVALPSGLITISAAITNAA